MRKTVCADQDPRLCSIPSGPHLVHDKVIKIYLDSIKMSWHLLGPAVHEGVGLQVDGGGEVDSLHALVRDGEGSGCHDHLLVHQLPNYRI